MTARVSLDGMTGGWADSAGALNALVTDLVAPTTEVARVIKAVAAGDLSQKMVLEIDGKSVQGEFLRIGATVNTMVDQLNAFASEVTRVAKEVGTEGKLGGQAQVPGVAGAWKDLTDNVNYMASNLTNQVRNIADVTTAVAKGDLSRKITVDVRGELLELKNTVNTMVDQLNGFASEVTRCARGGHGRKARWPGQRARRRGHVEGPDRLRERHGGQPHVQLRDVSGVATAIASGDLTRRSPSRPRVRSCRSRTSSTRWSTHSRSSPAKSRASRAK
jgi:HAMP domain-containing protein